MIELETAGAPFLPTAFQQEITEAARQFLTRHAEPSPTEPARSSDAALWARIAGELGWVGLVVGEERGGMGGGLADMALVAEEAGRVLLGAPLADSAALAYVLDRFAPESAVPWVGRLASGEVSGTVAYEGALEAEATADGWRVSGQARNVVWGERADALLVRARTADGPLLLLVGDAVLGAASPRPVRLTDETRPVTHLSFDGVPVRADAAVARGGDAERLHELARAVRAVLMAAEDVGGADRALDLSVDYAKERRQFGVPIGSFQAVKHKLADMLRLVEHSRTAARVAAAALDATAGDGDLLPCAVAKSYCDEAFVRVAAETIQVHGGIGFTTEHPAHLFYKRASVNAHLVWPALACRQLVRAALFDGDSGGR